MRRLMTMGMILALGIVPPSLCALSTAKAQSELTTKAEELADKLTSSNAGEIAGLDGQIVYINLGEKDGACEGTEFEVVRLGEVMMVGNKALHKETPIGEIQITKVRKDMSLAKVTSSSTEIKTGDRIYQKHKKASRIALTEFAYGDNLNTLTRNIYESLAVSFAQKGLQVVERSQLDKILREQKIAHSGMIDMSTAQKLGQLLGTEGVLLGSVTDMGNGIAIRARWVDANKGVVITAAQVEVTKTPQILAMLGANKRDINSSQNVEPSSDEANPDLVDASQAAPTTANKFIPGVYSDNNGGATCTIAVSSLLGGRSEVAISCQRPTIPPFSASWATGPIKGHPFELDLRGAGIEKIQGHENYSWGKVGNANYWWSCFHTAKIISARQVGNSIALSCYEGNQQKCGVTLVRKEDEKVKGK